MAENERLLSADTKARISQVQGLANELAIAMNSSPHTMHTYLAGQVLAAANTYREWQESVARRDRG